MKLGDDSTITSKQIAEYEEFVNRIKLLIDKTEIPNLYNTLLEASFELRANNNYFSTEPLKRFTAALLSKTLIEGWAIIGCYERAANLSVYHHSRAVLELVAMYHWVTYNKSKINKRIEKYFEYDQLLRYQLYIRTIESDYGKIAKALRKFSPNEIEFLKSKVEYWKKIFNPPNGELLKIKCWYQGTLIQNMLDEFPDKRLTLFYEEFSHATHFSPLTHTSSTRDIFLEFQAYNENLSEFNKHPIIFLDSLRILYDMIRNEIGFETKIKL